MWHMLTNKTRDHVLNLHLHTRKLKCICLVCVIDTFGLNKVDPVILLLSPQQKLLSQWAISAEDIKKKKRKKKHFKIGWGYDLYFHKINDRRERIVDYCWSLYTCNVWQGSRVYPSFSYIFRYGRRFNPLSRKNDQHRNSSCDINAS